MKILALLLLPLSAFAADITSTRVTAYDFQTQDAAGVKISDHQRFDTALVACLNTPTCVFVAGGKYRITRPSTPPPPVPVLGTAALTWTAPTLNTDGSAIRTPVTYKVYHGLSAASLTDIIPVTGLTYTYTGLASGTHYFAVSTVTPDGESVKSAISSKVIP